MSADWNTYRIEDIAEKITIGPFGSRMKSDAYVVSGVPVIRGTNLTGSKEFSGDWVFITEKLAKQLENCCVSNGDLVFPHRGSIGEVGLVDNKFPQYMMSSSLMKLRCNPNIADSEFIYYFFKSHQGRYELLKNASQVGTPGIGQPLTSLKNIAIKLPPLEEQRKISKILSDLDDKIHLNTQINQTLESIAQAIFKSWFIDFEPVRAKIAAKQEGKDPELAAMCAISGKSEGELQQMPRAEFAELRATAALFPDELVDSELGEVPKGWEYKKLKDLCRVINGRAYKNTEFKDQGTPIVRIQNLTGGGKTVFSDLDLPQDKLIEKEDFIYAWSATFGPYIWRGSKSIYHYHIWKMDVDETIISRYFLYLTMFRKTESMKSAGTGSIFTHLTKVIMESQDILIADNAINMLFKDRIDKIFKLISLKSDEINNLERIRDTLLPKLLSGEIDVSYLQETVDD